MYRRALDAAAWFFGGVLTMLVCLGALNVWVIVSFALLAAYAVPRIVDVAKRHSPRRA